MRKIKYFYFIIIFVACFVIFPLFTATAAELKKIVVVVSMPVPACETHFHYFIKGLEELGYIDGNNMSLTVVNANGDRQFAENELQLIQKAGKPDIVVTIATLASQAAQKVFNGTNVPIFFFQVSDPAGAGLIKKMASQQEPI
ncbi:MAG TPA: hypothetical protein DCY00_06240 [Actinobacteria bacterium]|nr:hypothetical protein [Actinomycetota bacterium]